MNSEVLLKDGIWNIKDDEMIKSWESFKNNSQPEQYDFTKYLVDEIQNGVIQDANIWVMGIFDMPHTEVKRNWLFRIIIKIKRLFKWQ